jgi:uncharacterized phage protein (TIGR02216 family)
LNAAVRQAFPWDHAIGFGLGVLRLAPTDFWNMTPRELAFAFAPFQVSAHAPDRAVLDQLLTQFPDEEDRT